MSTTAFWMALSGGALIGLSATLMLLLHGRVTGISGIVNGVMAPEQSNEEREWRLFFILGLIVGGAVFLQLVPGQFASGDRGNLLVAALAGLLVGVGTQMGSGCTSGHGVCGLSRGSSRSLTATVVFMAFGMLSALFARLVLK